MAYLYETHLHTSPASRCAKHKVDSALRFYQKLGYDGVFITNHFLNSSTGADPSLSRAEKLNFFCRDYFDALHIANEIGIKVFFGTEMTDLHTDFLVYGLSPEWYCEHPELLDLPFEHMLDFLHLHGAFIVHAHPMREIRGAAAIRLFPRSVDAVETVNACNLEFENRAAQKYARCYKLLPFAGSDNHACETQRRLAGIATRTPINSAKDFITLLREKNYRIFKKTVKTPAPNK